MKTKKINITYWIIIILISIISYNYGTCETSHFNEITTIISILLGFVLTSLSIIASSSYSKKLYNKESRHNNSQTLLHDFLKKYTFLVYWLLCTLILILTYNFIDLSKINVNPHLNINKLYISLIWATTYGSIIRFSMIFNIFAKYIIKAASSN